MNMCELYFKIGTPIALFGLMAASAIIVGVPIVHGVRWIKSKVRRRG